jgi:hypothetical protein
VFSAAVTSFFSTTNEMLQSDDPCAVARIFTFFFPRAAKVRPTSPEVARMFWPTSVTIAAFSSMRMCSASSCFRSYANSPRSDSTVGSAWPVGTIRQISFCADE